MPNATMTSKGQITIPKEIRDVVNAREGTRFDVRIDERGNIVLVPKRLGLEELLALACNPAGVHLTIEEMKEAVLDQAAAEDERIRQQYSRPPVHKR
jgi:AbrB family looped-hinge helix DNA binding protein